MVEFRLHREGFLTGPGLRFPAAFGRNGITAHKHEGDGATPAGHFKLLRVLYRADREKPPSCSVPIEPIGRQDGWCDDPAHAAYNTQIRLPFAAGHEQLHRGDDLYNIVAILDHNTNPAIPHRGSAIFIHVATPAYAPTDGCIALAAAHLRACLGHGLSAITID